MFCKYCGKQTDNTNGVCDDCAINYPAAVTPVIPAEAPATGEALTSAFGRSNAIRACIFSSVGATLSVISYVMSLCALLIMAEGGTLSSMLFAGISFTIAATALCIVGVVKGKDGISAFKYAKSRGTKPVATLVVGIASIVIGATGLMFCLISSIFGLVVLAA